MSVSLSRIGLRGHEHGTECPKCGNGSVFRTPIYKFLGLVYVHTEVKCEYTPCTYFQIERVK